MIITRTPFRVSIAGGGSDLPSFYRRHGYGAVISTAIEKFMYIIIHPYFHDSIRIKYSRVEDVRQPDDIQHPIVRECLRRVGVETGVEIASFADVSAGTGLGSSSSFTVGLLHALYVYRGMAVPKHRLAEEACKIEIDVLGEPIGKQDQYAAAFGGFNLIRFNGDETVEVTPLPVSKETLRSLSNTMRLYYVGGQHAARSILEEQAKNLFSQDIFSKQIGLLDMVETMRECLIRGDVDAIGPLLHEGWQLKRQLCGGITNRTIEDIYRKARNAGATGGKLLGAGGAGFLLLSHPDQSFLEERLGLRSLPLLPDREGSKLLFYE